MPRRVFSSLQPMIPSTKARSYARSKTQIENEKRRLFFDLDFSIRKKYIAFLKIRPTLMRDRKRKIPDRKSAVFDLAKSFSFREQKLSCVR